LTFITICCTASLATFQSKWELGVSGLNGFLLFLLFFILILTVFLLTVPLVFDKWDKLPTLNRWIGVPRSTWIFLITGTALSLLSALMVTVSGEFGVVWSADQDIPMTGEVLTSGPVSKSIVPT
jgi:hypothetical protein